jgi:hypothetical protein
MKTILLTLLLTVANGLAATLHWDPSSPVGAPAAVLYRVYISPVADPSVGIWTVMGETSSTNMVLTSSAFRMYRVTGLSAGGVESDPSNTVTNTFTKPNPPGRANISARIEDAPSLEGPWQYSTNLLFSVDLGTSNQFFRTITTVALEQPLQSISSGFLR